MLVQVVPSSVEVVVRARGCGSTGPKRLVRAVVGMVVEVVSLYIEAAGVGVVMVCVDPPTDMVVRVR